ncbi:MAG TPA: hypothetical protein VJT31_35070 [Rugosimonospora sp.]|nr:hypothetical protein [Rugosimonospora sp.]
MAESTAAPGRGLLLFTVPGLRLDIRHQEPADRAPGRGCGPRPRTRAARLAWAARHAWHLRLHWRPAGTLRRWITDRCADCGQRFHWAETRHSYESSDQVWHEPCMTLRHVRSQLDDLTAYVQFTDDRNARWRAERRLQHLDATGRATTDA